MFAKWASGQAPLRCNFSINKPLSFLKVPSYGDVDWLRQENLIEGFTLDIRLNILVEF